MMNVRPSLVGILLLALLAITGCGDDSAAPDTRTLIKGKVTDLATGKPIQGAYLTTLPPTQSVATDASGNYQIQVATATVYTVTAAKDGYSSRSVTITAIAEHSVVADIGLSTGSGGGNNTPPTIPSSPTPADKSTSQSMDQALGWTCSDTEGDSLSYDVYFGTVNPPTQQITQDTRSMSSATPQLDSLTTYYWMVVAKDNHGGVTSGPVWQFTTGTPPHTTLNAVRFHGPSLQSGDWISVPDAPQLALQQGSFTLEAWVKFESFGTGSEPWDCIISRSIDNSHTDYLLLLERRQILFQTRNLANRVYGGTELKPGAWYHIAAVQDAAAGMISLYINGEIDGSRVLAGTNVPTFTDNIYIGARNYLASTQPAYSPNGIIHELRVWNVARTQAQIVATKNHRLVGNEPGLVGYWPMNEGEGTTVRDKSGHGHDGAFRNSPGWVTEVLPVQ
jgi:hypothetical protein